MIIESLELLNFRNYERECFIFDENTIVGLIILNIYQKEFDII